MAMQIGSGRGKTGRYRPLAEINVTPLVDVMLVLLVIFMITAPLMTSSVNVDLPKASASPITPEKDPITVSVASDSKVYLANDGMDLSDLVAKLQQTAQSDPDRRIYVRGDKNVPYGRMIEVMGTIKQGGFNKVALLVEQTDSGSGPPGATAPSVPASAGPGLAAPTLKPLTTTAVPSVPALSPRKR
jgi:biopolymer transport protein TolR